MITLFDKKITSFGSGYDELRYLEKACKKYSENPDYVFKSCIFDNNLYLIVLKKLAETKTNEHRKDVKYPKFAQFRANMLDVVEIFDILDPHRISEKSIINKYDDIETIYSVGQTVHSDKYDTDINKVCASGIHYFKSIEPAFMFRIFKFIKKWNDVPIRSWLDDGSDVYGNSWLFGDGDDINEL